MADGEYKFEELSGDAIKLLLENLLRLKGPNNFTKTLTDYLSEAGAIPIINVNSATQQLEPNKFYVWNEASSLTITLGSGPSGVVHEFMFQFKCPSNAGTALTMPSNIMWADDDVLEPEAGMTYQVSIVNGLAVYAGWEAASA